jgi:hypothetical protein
MTDDDEPPYQRHPDKTDRDFAQWKMTRPDLERDFLAIANEYRRTGQTFGGVSPMTELKRVHGKKYKGSNNFGPRIAHWFVHRHPEFTDTVKGRR